MSVVTVPVLAVPVAPAPLRLTVEEFVARYENVPGAELVQGIVKEPAMPWPKHGFLCAKITTLLSIHAETHDLGRVMSNDSWVRTTSDSVRGGDVLFFSYHRLPKGDVPDGLLPVAPDLVVEVKSPSDRWMDLFIKVGEYLPAGVRVVVVVDPETATVSVYRPDHLQQTLTASDELTVPDVLPGFAIAVSRLLA